jgi:DNA-binding protein HU-beta
MEKEYTMNKAEFIAEVSEKLGVSKRDGENAVNTVVDTLTQALVAGDKVQFIGFGQFETRPRAAKQVRNPRTGEALTAPATVVPVFRAGKALKDAVAAKAAK